MSILIKDMEMPDCCFHCVCSDDGCGITGDILTTKEMRERPDWCPLEELPEPCEDAVKTITEASFTGKDGLDYVETLVALNALKMQKSERKPGKWIDERQNHDDV